MWFLLYPGKATIEIQSIDKFKWVSNNFDITKQKEDSPDTRYTSALNHLRFYLPDMFPKLEKIVLLDHDVIVQRDLTELWNIEMMGKTNGAVETCQVDDPSFRSMDMFIKFSDPLVASKFDVKACTWAFGMNIFDLQEWRRRNLTREYEEYLLLVMHTSLYMLNVSFQLMKLLPFKPFTVFMKIIGQKISAHTLLILSLLNTVHLFINSGVHFYSSPIR